MSENDPTFGEYLSEAFNLRWAVPGLGGLPVNWMGLAVFGVLGILNPGFLLIGAGLEVAFLFGIAQNERFRNYVRGKRLVDANAVAARSWAEQERAILAGLSMDAVARYQHLGERIARVRDVSQKAGLAGMVGELAEDGLARLQRIFLGLLQSQESIRRDVDTAQLPDLKDELDRQVRELEALGAAGDPRIVKSFEQTIAILRRRIGNIEGAEANVAYIQSELRRIEHQAELLIEEAALAAGPDALASRIDAVTATFDETAEWMKTHAELLREVDVEVEAPRPPPRRPQGTTG